MSSVDNFDELNSSVEENNDTAAINTADTAAENNQNIDIEDEPALDLSYDEKIGALEAILFSMGDSIEISQLADTLCISEGETEELIEALEEKYSEVNSGICILRLESAVQLATKRDYYEILKKLVVTPRRNNLSDTVLETLSIVAYKQPVTRVEIEKIRGVACDHQINKLIEFDLIKEVGRLDAPGRPILFGTTEQFLRSFGVSSVDDLPQVSQDQIADFAAEAEKEVAEIKI